MLRALRRESIRVAKGSLFVPCAQKCRVRLFFAVSRETLGILSDTRDVSCQSAFWRNPVVPLRFSRVSASFRYMAMCRVFQKRTRCVATAMRLRAVCALSVFAFRRRVHFDVLRTVCAFLLFAPLFFKKCVQTDIFMECSCFSSLRPCRRPPGSLHSFYCLCLCFFKKCTRTDIFGECRCFSLPRPCLLPR